MTSVFRISLDIHQTQSQVSIPASMGDDNVRLIIRLTEKGNPFDIEDGSYAIFSAVKPDGNPLYNDCAIYRNSTIVYDFTKQTTAVEGITKCQIHLYDTYGRKLHSPHFQIVVHPEIYGNEIESTAEYSALEAFVQAKGDIEQDIDNNASAIASLKKKVTTSGTVTIRTTQWSYAKPNTVYLGLPSSTVQKGHGVLFMPLNNATKEAAAKARLSVGVDTVIDGGGDYTDHVLFVRAEEGAVPTVDLDLGYIVLRTAGDLDAMVALIGVDAYGEGGSTTDGVNQTEVEEVIKRLVPEWARAKNPPPYPVTSVNDKTGTVNLNASDVGARPSTWTPTASEVGAATPEAVQTLVNDLARKTTQDLANYYTKSQTFNKDEINTLVSAIPKFKIEVVTSLPTSNISDTTVYLVKSGADSSNLYTEYIRANGVWERIGTQTVDLTGYATEAWVNELLDSYIKTADIVNGLTSTATDKPLSAAQGKRLNELIDLLDAGKITTDEANDLIANALKLYTPTDELPDALPNPKKLIINGIEYDGSKEISLQLDDVDLVESLEQMTDTSKYYGIRNAEDKADIWWYVYRKGHTNRLSEAQPLPSEVEALKGTHTFTNGYWPGVRIVGSSGAYKADDTANVTGLIPAKPGQTVLMRHIVLDRVDVSGEGNGGLVLFYNGNQIEGDIIEGKHKGYSSTASFIQLLDNGDYSFTIPTTSEYSGTKYIRIQFSIRTPNPADIIIVFDEPITDYETGYHWEDSGVDTSLGNDTALLELTKRVTAIEEGGEAVVNGYGLPEYWQNHIAAKIAEIQSAQAAARQRCVTWATVTDIHDDSNAGGTGRLIKAVCDQCGINTVLCLGDYSTRATKATADRCRQSIGNSNNILAPVADRLLGVRGNHDGGYKTSDAYLLKPSEVDSIIQYPMASGLEITYDAVGSGYYATDKSKKVRYIMLNTDHRGANPDSTVASDGSSAYPYMSFYRYTQVQMDMVTEALTTIPNDSWTVIVASHVPPIGSVDRYGDGSFVVDLSIRLEDYLAMRKLLNAYVNRTTATVSYAGSATWDKISLTVDFTAAKGHLAEYQSGHLHRYLYFGADHVDPKSKTALGFPIRTLRSDGFNENYDSTNNSELDDAYANQRVLGTTTEHSFVVCVHNIDTRETTCIHVGAQEE